MFHKLINLLENCQLKFSNDEKGEFEGYASVFDSVDQVGDTIEKGAFASSIASGRNIKGFINHAQHEIPVIDWLKLSEDSTGLHSVGRVDLNHKDGPTLYSAMKRGAMDGLSIGFTMNDGDFEQKGEGRIIKNMSLMEISSVNFPCEGQARIAAVKADVPGLITLKDFEDYLRDAGGFSKSMATALVSQLVNVSRRDAEDEIQRIAKHNGAEALSMISEMRKRFNG